MPAGSLRQTLLKVLFCSWLSTAAAHRADCACLVDTIGVDPTFATGSVGALLGEAPGQTFTVQDTLVDFLRVWRVASEDSAWYVGIHLYITETNASGLPLAGQVVLDGPTLTVPSGDGVHPIEFRWSFDPPLALPHPGKYAFFLFQSPCLAYWDILATNRDPYAGGDAWLTGRSNCTIFRNINLNEDPAADLVFQIGTCTDVITPVRKGTWGQLKLLYR
jgi:hypothetical protein